MRMVWPSRSVAWTMITGTALTSRCRARMRRWLAPSARAASTKSRARRLRHSPRTMRATWAQVTSPITRAVFGEARAEQRDHHQDQEERRDRQEDVGDPHDPGVHAGAEVAGDPAHRGADQDRQHRGEEADLERHPAPPDDAREHVAAVAVRPEPVGAGRRLEALEQGLRASSCRARWRARGSRRAPSRPRRRLRADPRRWRASLIDTRCAGRSGSRRCRSGGSRRSRSSPPAG